MLGEGVAPYNKRVGALQRRNFRIRDAGRFINRQQVP
jgi:hypothetical protein